eukprot:snap_masked-scaffold_1-processed-gene-32.1-mRNA-1 protein AED:1.00 eAED:1.00 QI:0/-1/0/0/-1/1/1/0/320
MTLNTLQNTRPSITSSGLHLPQFTSMLKPLKHTASAVSEPLTPMSMYSNVTESSATSLRSNVSKKPKRKRKYTYQCREVSSFKVFNTFVKRFDNGTVDASGIVSPECYAKWVESRRKMPKKPEEAFRRALTAHCRGVDGRRPFAPEVEENLLKELRKKKQWRCFENLPNCGSIGVQGFPSLGYHERLAQQKPLQQGSKASNGATVSQNGLMGKHLMNGYPMGGPQLAWDYHRYSLPIPRQQGYLGLHNNFVMPGVPSGNQGRFPLNFGLKTEGTELKVENSLGKDYERRASAVYTKNILGFDINSGLECGGSFGQVDPFY